MASASANVCLFRYVISVLITVLTIEKCITTHTNFYVYKRTSDTHLQNSFSSVTTPSDIGCCLNCEQISNCNSVSYKQSTEECLLSGELLATVSMNGQTDTDWNTYSKDEWMLVFRATPGIGGDVYTAWKDGGLSVTTDDVTCMTTDVTTCSQNYRNPIVDSWTSIGMSEVKFAFYKNNTEVAYVIFDATGSDDTSWFHNTNIKTSSWSNIASEEYSFFSILGVEPSRRFLIHHLYDGCPSDAGYSAVIISGAHPCLYDQHTSYPQFLYASSATFGNFGSMSGVDKADVMAIFIK